MSSQDTKENQFVKKPKKKLTCLSRFFTHYKKQFIEYVTCKEDMHEMSYRQADRGFLKRSSFITLGTLLRAGYLAVVVWLAYNNYMALKYTSKFVSLDQTAGN